MTHGLETIRKLNNEAVRKAQKERRNSQNTQYGLLDKGGYRNTRTSEPLGLRVDLSQSHLRKSRAYSANGSSEIIPVPGFTFGDLEATGSVDAVTEAVFVETRFKANGTKRVCQSSRNSSEMIPIYLLAESMQVKYPERAKPKY